MTNEEYERAYYAGREILHNRGKKVGCPVFGPDLVRSCPVDGFLLNDFDLLKDAWGKGLTNKIFMELAEGDALPNCCPEGNRLWQKYADSTRLNLEIIIRKQTAARKKDSVIVLQLAPVLEQAAELRLHDRRFLLEHTAHNP
jgi:hypothetical protein